MINYNTILAKEIKLAITLCRSASLMEGTITSVLL